MRNIVSDGTYIYITLRTGATEEPWQRYRLQRRLASDGSLGAGCWDIDLSLYHSMTYGVTSICIDESYIYTYSFQDKVISKFDISDGSSVWSETFSNDYYKIRQYGSYVYVCGLSNSSWKPVIDQLNKSNGVISYTFEGAPDFAQITAMDIDSTGFYISIYDASDPMTIPIRIIYKHLDFSWSEIWSTPVDAPGLPGTYNDIRTETLKVGSTDIIATGSESEYIDPDWFSRGRFDTINKTTGVITETKFWPDDVGYCTMKGIDNQGSGIFIGGYKTVPVGDPNYNPNNTKWVMTRGNPTIT